MIIKNKRYNTSYEEPYIKLGEGVNGQLPLGENLDITNNASVIRAGVSTVVNKDGNLQNIPANYPRFDYDPITHEFKGILIENTATNLMKNSNTLDSCSASNSVLSNISTITPYGVTGTVKQMVATASNTTHDLYFATNTMITANTWHTVSFFVKKRSINDLNKVFLTVNASSKYDTQIFNLDNEKSGYVEANTNNIWIYGNAKAEKYNNGWFRCSVTFKTSVVPTNISISLMNKAGWGAFVGNSNMGVWLFGLQVENHGAVIDEKNTSSTSYIPTTTAAVTRNFDKLNLNLNKTINGTNIFNYNNFSMMFDCRIGNIKYNSVNIGFLCDTDYAIDGLIKKRLIVPLKKELIGYYCIYITDNEAPEVKYNIYKKKNDKFLYETKCLINIDSEYVNVLDSDLKEWMRIRKYKDYILNSFITDTISQQHLRKLYVWNKKINDFKYLYI